MYCVKNTHGGKFMLLDAFDSVIEGINEVGRVLGLGWIAVIALSLVLITLIVSFFCTVFSLELRTLRAVEKINSYLEANPFINDENLVEFNKLMKKIPAPMRAQWQQYMVNRDKKPSVFFSEENCIEKPFKASAYNNQIIAVRSIIISVAIISFVFCLGALSNVAGQTIASTIVQSALLPLSIWFIGEIYLLFLKGRRNSAISELYVSFADFQHLIDRATTTLPDYIDYEILFTRKEIVSGIPVLQEYLQQRALFEQEQIKKAKESQVEHEDYDFSALGINGSLVMDRAMRECELYLGNRKRIIAEIAELQGSQDLLRKSFDEKSKTSQRKLRDIQDSLDRLKEKLDATTNIIVGNDLRQQRENEIQKQRQLEKEIEEDTNKFDSDNKKIESEIAAKQAEIEEFRKSAESILNGEFKTYSDKIYASVKQIADGQVKEELDGVRANNQELQIELEERDKALTEKTVMYDEKLQLLEEYSNKLAEQEQILNEIQAHKDESSSQIAQKDEEIFSIKRDLESRNLEIEKKNAEIDKQKEIIKELKHKKRFEVYRYFDAYGNEFYVDENNNPYYLDENGDKLYSTSGIAQNEEAQPNEVPNQETVVDSENTQNGQAVEMEEATVDLKDEDLVVEPAEDVAENSAETETSQQPANETENAEQASEVPNEIDSSKFDEELAQKLAELDKEAQEEDSHKKAKPEPEFHKPVDDFKWENSNAPEDVIVEPVEEPAQEVEQETQPAEENKGEDTTKEVPTENVENSENVEAVEAPVAEPNDEPVEATEDNPVENTENKPVEETENNALAEFVAEQDGEANNGVADSDDEISEIEKQIALQNAELEKEHKDLSNQLEETKAIADKDVEKQEKPKKSTKKPTAKKKTDKKPATKKASKKPAAKKVAKKPAESKKKTATKSKDKPVAKKETKKSAPKKTAKTSENKPQKTSKPKVAKKQKPTDNGDNSSVKLGDISLMEFNEQLKSVLKEIDGADGDNK